VKAHILLCLLLAAGCASPPPRVIKIQSEPPGARIFFALGGNEDFASGHFEYIGQTPCEFTPEQNGDGTFKVPWVFVYSLFVAPVAVFRADPPTGSTDLYSKRQVLHGGTIATPAVKVPAGLFFDLTKPDPPK
jgi:hypothetical protein